MRNRLIPSGFRLPASGLLLFALTACASLGRHLFDTPTVELKDIHMKAIGLQGGSMDIILSVDNPNEAPASAYGPSVPRCRSACSCHPAP